MAHTRVWEETTPVGTEDVSLGDDRIRNLKVDLGERLEDLLYGFNISDGTGDEATPGVKVLNFKEQASIATPSANQINIAAKVGVDGDAKGQLFAKDEDGNERQLTKTSGSALRLNVKAGDYAADSIDEDDIRLTNNNSLTGRNQAGSADVNIVKVNTSDEVELGEDGTTIVKLADGSKLASSDAPTANAELANKKYVDDQDAFSAWTTEDADSATLAAGTTYTATSDGFVNVYGNKDGIKTLKITVVHGGITTVLRENVDTISNLHVSHHFSVASGETFLITDDTGSSAITINWRSVGALSKPTK